jgi:hypothetical protein
MRKRGAFALLLALALGVPAAAASPPPTSRVHVTVSPGMLAARALEKYHAAMASFNEPANMVFTYAETRTGPARIVTGVHRVYRDSAGDQRNDTMEINGSPVRPPLTRTYQRTTWPYFADEFSASATDYDARFIGAATVNGRRSYSFQMKRRTSATFEIVELDLDTATGLPLRVAYTVQSGTCDGQGTLEYAPAGPYWLPTLATAECTTGKSAEPSYKHAIRFSDYAFPVSIPQDVLHPPGATAQ